MPIYEYGCEQCGHTFELLQKVSDDPPGTCPSCGKDDGIKKLVSRTSFVLKGGGWYKDHYGLKGGGDSSSSDSGSSTSSTSGSSAGSDD